MWKFTIKNLILTLMIIVIYSEVNGSTGGVPFDSFEEWLLGSGERVHRDLYAFLEQIGEVPPVTPASAESDSESDSKTLKRKRSSSSDDGDSDDDSDYVPTQRKKHKAKPNPAKSTTQSRPRAKGKRTKLTDEQIARHNARRREYSLGQRDAAAGLQQRFPENPNYMRGYDDSKQDPLAARKREEKNLYSMDYHFGRRDALQGLPIPEGAAKGYISGHAAGVRKLKEKGQ